MICKSCGSQIDDGLKSCPNCGCEIGENESIVTNQSTFNVETQPINNTQNFETQSSTTNSVNENKKSGDGLGVGALILGIASIVLSAIGPLAIILGIIGIILSILNKNKSTKKIVGRILSIIGIVFAIISIIFVSYVVKLGEELLNNPEYDDVFDQMEEDFSSSLVQVNHENEYDLKYVTYEGYKYM